MKNTYKIGLVGYGVVGKGIHNLFKDEVQAIYDPNIIPSEEPTTKSLGLKINNKELFKNLDIIFICVPTNTSNNGMSADTSIVNESLLWLHQINFEGVVVIKSTVPPSVIKMFAEQFHKLRIVFSPEYMGESKYFVPPWSYPDPSDMRGHTWQVFGGDKKDTSFCVDVFKRRMGVDTQFFQTDHLTAALTKYMENSFFAMKVTFCNEWYEIAKTYGVDYNELRECWLADPRVNKNHTLVFPKDRGYGGKCFPKDVKAIIYDSTRRGYEPQLMKTVDEVNNKFRK